MKELREIARAYLKVASDDIKEEAQQFFHKMNKYSDGKVFLYEYLEFTSQERYKEFNHPHFFNQLCRRDRRYLDYMDVMTLYYIIRSGRPICRSCGQFIEGVYFCCIHCFHRKKSNYCLCTRCLEDQTYIRRSDHFHQFLDNFTLLDMQKKEALKRAPSSSQVSSPHANNNCREIVPARQANTRNNGRWNDAAKAVAKVVVVAAKIIACVIQ